MANLSSEPTGLDRARLTWLSGNAPGALWLVRGVLLQNRDHGQAWELRGLIHRDLGEADECVAALEHASLLIPLSSLGRVALAESYGRTGRRGLARDLFREMVRNPETPVSVLLQVATGLDELDAPASAMQACRISLARDPQCAQACYDMSYYAARSGYPLRIVESLARRAISLEPERIHFRVGLVSLLMQHDRTDEAGEVISAVSPDRLQSLNCRCCLERIADLCESLGDWGRVVVCRDRLLRLEATWSEPADQPGSPDDEELS